MERARRYRTTVRWVSALSWLPFVAYWVVAFGTDSPLKWVLLAAWLPFAAVDLFLRRKISQTIGRKWSPGRERKERKDY